MSINLMKAHSQWRDRPEDQRLGTLEELDEAVRNRQQHSRQRDITLSELSATHEGDSISLTNGMPATLSHWSFGQLSQRLGAPAGYLRSLPVEKSTDLLNHHLDTRPDDKLKLLTFEDESGENRAQAVTSRTYGRVWDADLTKALLRIQEASGGKWYNPKAYSSGNFGGEPEPSGLYASDRDVFAFLIDGGSMFDAGPRAEMNRGFFAWNSEVGNSTLGVCTFGFNTVCGNHIVWGATDINQFTIVHRSGAPRRFEDELIPMLHDYANASMKPMEEAVTRAIEYRLPKRDNHWWKKLVGSKQFTKGEVASAIDFAKREEGQCETLWDLVQGFTASAREYAHIDARVRLEKRSGKLLDIVKDSSTAVLV